MARGPQICGRKVSRRLGQCGIPRIPYVRFMLQRFHVLRAAAFGFMRGVQGVARGSGSSARTEALPTNLPTSAFREKENPEEITMRAATPMPQVPSILSSYTG